MIDRNIVFLDSNLNSKNTILNFLISNLQDDNYLDRDAHDFKNKILQREKEVTTYMGNAIAIPHAKSSEVKRPFITFLRLKKPLEWNKGQKDTVSMIFMLGVPEKEGEVHLQVLSNLARKLINKDILKKLEFTTDPEEAVQILDEE